jgi:hypothetical protein
MKTDLVVGIDVAAGATADRSCVAVALRVSGRGAEVAEWYEARAAGEAAPEDLVRWICALDPAAVAIDAPQAPGQRVPEAGRRPARSSDADLMRRGLMVYHPPARAEALAQPRHAWLLVGWDLFGRLRRCGYAPPAASGLAGAFGQEPAVLEVYPHAAFATLLGGIPPGKLTRPGAHLRVMALRALRVRWDEYFDHDSLDALACATTAWRFVQGRTTCVGSRSKELIWLPVGPHELLPRYGRLGTPRQQTAALQRLRES